FAAGFPEGAVAVAASPRQDRPAKGEILKRPTRTDCKSVGFTFAGSNPALPTLLTHPIIFPDPFFRPWVFSFRSCLLHTISQYYSYFAHTKGALHRPPKG